MPILIQRLNNKITNNNPLASSSQFQSAIYNYSIRLVRVKIFKIEAFLHMDIVITSSLPTSACENHFPSFRERARELSRIYVKKLWSSKEIKKKNVGRNVNTFIC